MVVDDDPVALQIAAAVLEAQGHEVVMRDSALGTSVAVLQEQPDVLVLDINMPGISGRTLLDAIREQGGQAAVIFYSGREAEELQGLVDETGVLGAVAKAVDPGELASAFSVLLDQVSGKADGPA
jgi:CheY-like chemotaxis protein